MWSLPNRIRSPAFACAALTNPAGSRRRPVRPAADFGDARGPRGRRGAALRDGGGREHGAPRLVAHPEPLVEVGREAARVRSGLFEPDLRPGPPEGCLSAFRGLRRAVSGPRGRGSDQRGGLRGDVGGCLARSGDAPALRERLRERRADTLPRRRSAAGGERSVRVGDLRPGRERRRREPTALRRLPARAGELEEAAADPRMPRPGRIRRARSRRPERQGAAGAGMPRGAAMAGAWPGFAPALRDPRIAWTYACVSANGGTPPYFWTFPGPALYAASALRGSPPNASSCCLRYFAPPSRFCAGLRGSTPKPAAVAGMSCV
jgi:hypothetical protein